MLWFLAREVPKTSLFTVFFCSRKVKTQLIWRSFGTTQMRKKDVRSHGYKMHRSNTNTHTITVLVTRTRTATTPATTTPRASPVCEALQLLTKETQPGAKPQKKNNAANLSHKQQRQQSNKLQSNKDFEEPQAASIRPIRLGQFKPKCLTICLAQGSRRVFEASLISESVSFGALSK